MKTIKTTYKKWEITYSVLPNMEVYNGYTHYILVKRNDEFVSSLNICNKKKNLDPYMFSECSELWQNSPHWREISSNDYTLGDNYKWEQLIRDLDLLSKVENKKK